MKNVVYTECELATMSKGDTPYGLIEGATLVIENQTIAWIGRLSELPAKYHSLEQESLEGRLVTPALIDCHTHLVFAGNRAQEFEMRLGGASYEDLARSGGGIMSTVNATRNATDDELVTQSLRRLDNLISEGVAVVEIKSGYGLTIKDEVRMLRVARKLETLRPVKIVTTWLAAHAVPPEYTGQADSYIDEVVIPGLFQACHEGLVDAVDGFCENIAFSPAQIEKVFKAAQSLNRPVKLHAEQLSDLKGALLLAESNGISADHLEYLSEDDVEQFAKSGAVAVLLPGAFYTLKETKLPPIGSLRRHGVDIAIATDCNPGSSPLSSLLTAMNMACTEFSLTPEESLAGTTRCAAKALGLNGSYGVITPGASAELVVWNLAHPAELSYWINSPGLYKRISNRSKNS
jgi:imidazolonepropionase